ncbi:Protein N-acetyltransferase, RimJ/RimL family [Hathewaya proteolytica DSM 3090]|uniref:Protein N-acetyltransferase, RimJ/RimL family n=1 Tax=Hathewaya proteolytica DSM 3090 TaxID=1121331 RepID=A0A1M6SC66_9CLOT|nr:GNAT family protein [Hathewaya proteolytica]SHK42354.1 Protein N-acetyltransferase, RimJ/RimL family [Hathewaya proteolytica DSM 3090]
MNVILRDLKLRDKNNFFTWVRDKEVIKYSLAVFQSMNTDQDISKWFYNILEDKSTYNQAIVDTENGKFIGYAGICKISKTNLSGEYFIFIGDKNCHSKGVGTFVTKEILKYGFEKLNLNRIMLTVSEYNIGAIKAYRKANFKQEGIMRQACYRDGKFHDKIIMGILRSEWNKKGD